MGGVLWPFFHKFLVPQKQDSMTWGEKHHEHQQKLVISWCWHQPISAKYIHYYVYSRHAELTEWSAEGLWKGLKSDFFVSNIRHEIHSIYKGQYLEKETLIMKLNSKLSKILHPTIWIFSNWHLIQMHLLILFFAMNQKRTMWWTLCHHSTL